MWTKSSSNEKPLEVEPISNNRYLLHRNIQEVTKTDNDGKEYTVYEYEELLVNATEKAIVTESNERMDTVETAVVETAEVSANNEHSLADLESAIVELAEIINGGTK